MNDMIQGLIFESGRTFKKYLSDSSNNSMEDMLGFWTSTQVLSNEELTNMLTEISKLFEKYM